MEGEGEGSNGSFHVSLELMVQIIETHNDPTATLEGECSILQEHVAEQWRRDH